MKPNPHNHDGNELELQRVPARKLPASKSEPIHARPKTGPLPTIRPKTGPLPHINPKTDALGVHAESDPSHSDAPLMLEELPDISIDTTERQEGAAPIEGELPADGPPPSEKVDFENLPEFVWQRKMLKNVRIALVIASIIVALVIAIAFLGTGKGAKESLKPIIEGEKPAEEAKP